MVYSPTVVLLTVIAQLFVKKRIKNSFLFLISPAYFCSAFGKIKQNYYDMEQTKKYKGLWWLLFFGSTAALIFAIYSHWPWLTLILPFQTTAFVKAMDIM